VRVSCVEPLRIDVARGLLTCAAWEASSTLAARAAAALEAGVVAPGALGPVDPPGLVTDDVAEPVLQRLLSSTLLIRLTWPLRASTRPITVAPLLSEMLASAIRFPWNAVVVPSVAEEPICQ